MCWVALDRANPAGAVGPRDNDFRFLLDVHTRDLPGEATMRRYDDGDEIDLVIVGAGTGGFGARPAAGPARMAHCRTRIVAV